MWMTIVVFALPLVLALLLSWHPALGAFRHSALNPLLIFTAYVVLVAGDYMSITLNGHGELAQSSIVASRSLLMALQFKQATMMLVILLAFALAFSVLLKSPRHIRKPTKSNTGKVAVIIYLAILFSWFAALLGLGVKVDSLADTIAVKNASTWAAPLFILSMLLVPALTYALVRKPLRVAVPLVILSIAIVLLSGSRTRVLFVLIPFAFYLVRVRGIPMPRFYFFVGILAIGFLAIAALNVRLLASERKTIAFENTLTIPNIFELNDVSFAETSIGLARIGPKRTESYVGEDLVGFVLAPIPRSIIPLKPEPGSRQFTQIYDPYNYYRYQRGLTIGGINEITYDYAFPLAVLVVFGIAFSFAFLFVRASQSKSVHGFAWTVGLYISFYIFLKQDLQSSGQVGTIFAVYYFFMRFLEMMASRLGQPVPRAGLGRPERAGGHPQ